MAFKVGNSQSINTDVQNLLKRFTDDGLPYMYGSYKHTDQLFRDGGDDIRTSSTGLSEGGTVMRSYMASISDGTSENMRTAGNPFDVAYPITTSSPYGDQFLAAAGKLFIGAPSYSYTNYTSVNGRGGVMIVYPQRIKTSTDLNNATLTSTTYDFITGQSTLGLNNNGFGNSLAYAGGKLFVAAPYVDSSMGAVVQVGPGNYNDGNGPTLTTYAKPNVGNGPVISETLGFFGRSISAGNGKIAVSDQKGRVWVRGINYTNSGTPTNSSIETGSGWKKIVGPKGENINSTGGSEFGSRVVVSCGRIVVGDWAWNGSSGQLPNYVGAFHLYDLNGNFIRTVANPDPTSANHYFGWNVSVGSGRIVTTSAVTKALYIYNMDGDLVKKVDNPADQGNCPAGAYNFSLSITTTVGFGRIFFSIPYWDHNAKTDTGIVIGYDLDGNYLGYIYGTGSLTSGTQHARFGQGGIQVAPGRLYVAAVATSSTADGPMIHETPLQTAMTPYDVQAMEDGDL